MKTKKFGKKLTLNKETILNLDELNFIHGGDGWSKNQQQTACVCPLSVSYCNICPTELC
jgi:hypothetical protein